MILCYNDVMIKKNYYNKFDILFKINYILNIK